jgi:acyl carrier protein
VLLREAASALGVAPEKLAPEDPLDALGFDSLMAVEMVTRIERATGAGLPKMSLLRPGMSVADIAALVEEELGQPR